MCCCLQVDSFPIDNESVDIPESCSESGENEEEEEDENDVSVNYEEDDDADGEDSAGSEVKCLTFNKQYSTGPIVQFLRAYFSQNLHCFLTPLFSQGSIGSNQSFSMFSKKKNAIFTF